MSTLVRKEEPQQSLPQLTRMSDTYKMIVPRKVEEKIRYLIRKFPHTEWSGVLFYTHTGNFEDGTLTITCEDIYPMDLGTSGWTEFHMSEEVAAYMVEHMELFDCCLGLIHSHHSMGAFFSGQDSKMLQQEGNDTNCFVSLVVDTRGTYVAAVTRKIQKKTEVVTKSLGTSYEFFGDGEIKTDEDTMSEATHIVSTEAIEYFTLNVERELADNPLGYLDDRFDEIEQKKAEARKAVPQYMSPLIQTKEKEMTVQDDAEFFDRLHQKQDEEPTIWDKDTMKSLEVEPAPISYKPDEKLIHQAVCRMVCCSLTLNVEKFDLRQYIKRHLDNVYPKVFTPYQNSDYGSFDAWCDFIVEFMVTNFNDPNATAGDLFDEDMFYAAVAQAMYDELEEYINNEYIASYLQSLERYINY